MSAPLSTGFLLSRSGMATGRSAFNGRPVPGGQGVQVVQQTWAFFARDQNWTLKSTNEIVNPFWGMCLDTTSSGTHDHEHVMIWPCNGNLAQRWAVLARFLSGSACARRRSRSTPGLCRPQRRVGQLNGATRI